MPTGTWNGFRACWRSFEGGQANGGFDQTAGNGTGGDDGAQGRNYRNLAWFKDPNTPDNPDRKYWCKGPFYDTFLKWDSNRIDPDCLKVEPTDPNEACPLVGTDDNGAYTAPNSWVGKCNNQCEYWIAPNFGSTSDERAKRNDINLVFQSAANQDQLNIALFVRNVLVDMRLALGFSLLGAQCTFATAEQTRDGRFLNPKTLDIRIQVRFVDGYATMLGQNGIPFGGSSTGSGSTSSTSSGGARGTCDPADSSSSGGSAPGLTLDDVLDGSALLGVGLDIDEAAVKMLPTPTGGELPAINYHGCSGYLCSVPCNFAGLVPSILNSIISGGMIDGDLQAMLGPALAGILEGEVGGLLEEELGLPLDFTAMLAGHTAATKSALCALRMPTAGEHAKGYTCDHNYKNGGAIPNCCNYLGERLANGTCPVNTANDNPDDLLTYRDNFNLVCPNYGDCPCDDYDYDGLLNYQDPTPFSTARRGCLKRRIKETT